MTWVKITFPAVSMQAGDTFSLTKTDKYATLNGEAMLIEQTFTVDFKEKGVVHEVRYYR